MDKCAKCGNVGEDRRTLKMACFYEMNELGIPFDQEVLFSTDLEKLKQKSDPVTIDGLSLRGTPIVLQSGSVTTKEELHPQQLYTLRVCKRCRADWMEAILEWFQTEPTNEDEDVYAGKVIPVREKGAIRYLTEEEWQEGRCDE